jgi:Rrf2 family protein
MELTLGRRADYTVRAVYDLVLHHGETWRKAEDIARDRAIPRSYLAHLLADLVRAGIVTSHAGRRGGYQLTRPPAEIDLLTVVEVAEGAVASAHCVLLGGACPGDDHCAIHEPWARAQAALRDALRATTFADMAAVDALLTDERPTPPEGAVTAPR